MIGDKAHKLLLQNGWTWNGSEYTKPIASASAVLCPLAAKKVEYDSVTKEISETRKLLWTLKFYVERYQHETYECTDTVYLANYDGLDAAAKAVLGTSYK